MPIGDWSLFELKGKRLQMGVLVWSGPTLPVLSVSDGAKDAQSAGSEEGDLEVGSELREEFLGPLESGPKSYSK